MKLEIEVWKPVNKKNLEEIHYYYKGEYLGGLNPHRISKKGRKAIELILSQELTKENNI